MTDLKSLTLPEMTAFLQSLGEPAFRGSRYDQLRFTVERRR